MPKIKLKSEYNDLDKYKYYDGDIFYFKKNTSVLHNPHGPAVIGKSGYKTYFINGKRHRLDGPALIHEYGEEEYWINGKYLNKEEFDIHSERLKFLGKEHLICII